MGFLDLPTELRLQIYAELLVVSEPIYLLDERFAKPNAIQVFNEPTYPAILRVCKQVYREAAALLYSNNLFWIPAGITAPETAALAGLFLRQLGNQASLVRHLRISFPHIYDFQYDKESLLEELEVFKQYEHVKILELEIDVQDWNHYGGADWYWRLDSTQLQVLDECVKKVPSLEEVIIVYEVFGKGNDQEEEELRKEMSDAGWKIKFQRFPPRKWISEDGHCEFDNPDECRAYDAENPTDRGYESEVMQEQCRQHEDDEGAQQEMEEEHMRELAEYCQYQDLFDEDIDHD